MDNKFSSAIHPLILIAGSDKPLTSEDIAGSVGTNASYIRKIIGLLKKNDIIPGTPPAASSPSALPPTASCVLPRRESLDPFDRIRQKIMKKGKCTMAVS